MRGGWGYTCVGGFRDVFDDWLVRHRWLDASFSIGVA